MNNCYTLTLRLAKWNNTIWILGNLRRVGILVHCVRKFSGNMWNLTLHVSPEASISKYDIYSHPSPLIKTTSGKSCFISIWACHLALNSRGHDIRTISLNKRWVALLSQTLYYVVVYILVYPNQGFAYDVCIHHTQFVVFIVISRLN